MNTWVGPEPDAATVLSKGVTSQKCTSAMTLIFKQTKSSNRTAANVLAHPTRVIDLGFARTALEFDQAELLLINAVSLNVVFNH